MATKEKVNNASSFDFDLLDELINDAPTAGFGPRVSYGKLTIKKIEIAHWKGSKEQGRKIVTRPFVAGDTADKSKGEYIQMTLALDVKELNPSIDWDWERRVDVKKSNTQTGDKTNWSEVIEPSFVTVIGKDWSRQLDPRRGVYVAIEEPVTVEKKKTYKDREGNEKNNTTIRLLSKFKSLAECKAARDLRFAKNEDDDDFVIGADDDIPASVIAEVRGLVEAVDEDELEGILKNTAPYSQYSYEALMNAVNTDEGDEE